LNIYIQNFLSNAKRVIEMKIWVYNMTRFNSLIKESKKTRREMLLGNTKPFVVTPYRDRKGRVIYKAVRETYFVISNYRKYYGIKAAGPAHLIKNAPRAIRPKHFK
jgi:hypothetical protein